MNRRSMTRWELAARWFGAVAIGVLTLVGLSTLRTVVGVRTRLEGGGADHAAALIPFGKLLIFSVAMSAIYSLLVVAVCVPVWVVILRRGHLSALVAVAIGFVASMVCWIALNFHYALSAHTLWTIALPYSVWGAVAGLTTWWVSPR